MYLNAGVPLKHHLKHTYPLGWDALLKMLGSSARAVHQPAKVLALEVVMEDCEMFVILEQLSRGDLVN